HLPPVLLQRPGFARRAHAARAAGRARTKAAESLKIAFQKLRAAEPERPILVGVLDNRYHDVDRRDAAARLQLFDEHFVELLLRFLAARPRYHLHDHDLVGAWN